MRSIVNIFSAFLLFCLCLSTARAQASPTAMPSARAFSVARLVKVGDPGPNGGAFIACGFVFCTMALSGHHPLSNAGEITFAAAVSSPGCAGQAIYLASGKTLTTVADACSDTPIGQLSGQVGPASINNSGAVVLSTFSSDTGPLGSGLAALLLGSSAGLSKVIEQGDPSPFGAIHSGSCGFSEPFINDSGDVVFSTCTGPEQVNGVFVASNGGGLQRLVKDGDPAPDGGMFFLDFVGFNRINNRGDVLFDAGSARPTGQNVFGIFLHTPQSIQKVEVTGDILPDGNLIIPRYNGNGFGDLNDNGDVLFAVAFNKDGDAPGGLYLYSNGVTSKITGTGDPTPLGGTIRSFLDPQGGFLQFPGEFPIPAINNGGTVLFRAELSGASAPFALFLASTKSKAMLKVVAVGDKLDTGEVIKQISSFALNDRGQVAFTANGKGKRPLGVFLGTPASPSIASAKVKTEAGGELKLVIDGANFITNDSAIEVNGSALQDIKYPAAFQQQGGTTTRLTSSDPNLWQMLKPGQPVQITVLNSLTAQTSAAFPFVR